MKEYNRLVHKISANEVAGQMYQDGALEQIELNEIQQSHNDIRSAQFLLNIVLVRPRKVYWSFIGALKNSNQLEAYLLLTDDGLNKSILPFVLHCYTTAMKISILLNLQQILLLCIIYPINSQTLN